jgi:hypothetical protein
MSRVPSRLCGFPDSPRTNSSLCVSYVPGDQARPTTLLGTHWLESRFVISDGYWKRRFGARTDIADKAVVIAGLPFNISGVTEPNFFGLTTGSNIDVWVPLSTQPLVEPNLDPKVSMFAAADHWWVQIMGRLKPAVSRAQAVAALDVIFKAAANGGHSGRAG